MFAVTKTRCLNDIHLIFGFEWHNFVWWRSCCHHLRCGPIAASLQTNIIISDYQHENVCGAPCQLMLGLLMFNRNIFYYGDVAECGRVSVTPLQGSPHHYTPLPQSDGCEYFCKLLIWNNADNLRLRDDRVRQSWRASVAKMRWKDTCQLGLW